jgi:hypothetical protein
MEFNMNHSDYETLNLIEVTSTEKDDEYSIPLDISDIISICRDFNNLGWQIRNQVENILEVGVEESIKSGYVKQESLPHVKFFLRQVQSNPYFGDAASQAQDCLILIRQYEENHKIQHISN